MPTQLDDTRSLGSELRDILRTQQEISDTLIDQEDNTAQINKMMQSMSKLKMEESSLLTSEISRLAIKQKLNDKNTELKKLALSYDKEMFELNDSMYDILTDLNSLEQQHGSFLQQNNIELGVSKTLHTIQKNLQAGQVDKAKQLIEVAKVQKAQLTGIVDGDLQRFNLEEKLLEINSQFPDLTGEQVVAMKSLLGKVKDINTVFLDTTQSNKHLATILNEQRQSLEENEYSATNILNKIQGWKDNLLAIAQDPKIAAGLFGAVMVKRSAQFLTNMEDTRKELGLGATAGLELSGDINQAALSSAMMGVSLQETRESATAIVNETKTLNNINTESIKQIAVLNSRYGVNVQEAAKLQRLLREVNNNSTEIANSSLESMTSLAKANNIPINTLMSEVASDTEFFASFAKAGGSNIANAAADALKLGLGMSSVSSITNNLLDIESSISKEMEASVLLGRNINLNKARELAFTGDQEGMLQEVITQLGDINEWEQLNVLQRQAFSGAIGLSVSELQTMISQQDQLNISTGTQESFWGGITMGITGAIKGAKNYADVLGSGINMVASMRMGFPKLTESVVGGISKVGSKFTGIFKKGQQAQNIVSNQPTIPKTKGGGLSGFFMGWSTVSFKDIAKFTLATGVIIATLPALAMGLNQFTDVPWESAVIGMGSLLGLGLTMKLIGNQSGGIIKGALAMGIMSAALIPLGYALNQFSDVNFQDIIVGASALGIFGAAIFGFGALLTGPGALILGTGVIGILALSGAIATFGGSLMIMNSATSGVSGNMGQLIPTITQLAVLTPSMIAIGGGFAAMGAGMAGLSVGLAVLAPFLPVLGTLNKIKSNNTETTKENTKTTENTQLMSKLDTLINLMMSGGAVSLDGKEVGKWMGMKMKELKVYS